MTLIEAIARALRDADAGSFRLGDVVPAYYINRAQAALTAITEAGYAVVPVEPTEAMVEIAPHHDRDDMASYREIYRAMINAVTHCNHTNNGKAE